MYEFVMIVILLCAVDITVVGTISIIRSMLEETMPEETKIVHVKDHYEVYINGEFYCSADTVVEAAKEIENERAECY